MEEISKVIDWNNIDIIGDVHGCYNELTILLMKLGYSVDYKGEKIISIPDDRKIVFLGDFIDRGPEPVKVMKLAMDAVERGFALSVRGNHEDKVLRKLKKKPQMKIETASTVDLIKKEGEEFNKRVVDFIEKLPYIIFCRDKSLLIAHAGLKEELQDLSTEDSKLIGKIKAFALYGDTTGEFDEKGCPIRRDWTIQYSGNTAVVYGHIPVKAAHWRNNTIDIDYGCFISGHLAALRLPENIVISI